MVLTRRNDKFVGLPFASPPLRLCPSSSIIPFALFALLLPLPPAIKLTADLINCGLHFSPFNRFAVRLQFLYEWPCIPCRMWKRGSMQRTLACALDDILLLEILLYLTSFAKLLLNSSHLNLQDILYSVWVFRSSTGYSVVQFLHRWLLLIAFS